jgi:hypothetical protein
LTTLMRPSHPVRHFWPLRKALFLLAFTLGAFGEAIGNTGVGRRQARRASDLGLVDFDDLT